MLMKFFMQNAHSTKKFIYLQKKSVLIVCFKIFQWSTQSTYN